MLQKFQRWMQGRYGNDQLGTALFIGYLVCFFLSIFIHSYLLTIFAYVFAIITIFRIFSKNYQKRYAENQLFLKYYNPIKAKFHGSVSRFKQRKTYKFYRCSQCKQLIRVPKGKGKIEITCPKCKNKFIKRT